MNSNHVLCDTLTPFLYPRLLHTTRITPVRILRRRLHSTPPPHSTDLDTIPKPSPSPPTYHPPPADQAHLNPPPSSYSATAFTDRCTLTAHAGAGGHGCVSFLREKYIAEGPPNGGDGGTGGSIYIQAVRGETSLHKLARRGIVKAARGKNGQGKSQGGERGEDVLITVPVGTVVREVWRHDPIEEETAAWKEARREARRRAKEEAAAAAAADAAADDGEDNNYDHTSAAADEQSRKQDLEQGGKFGMFADRWILYPGALKPWETDVPERGQPRRSALAAAQAASPIQLDLNVPMERPALLIAGAVGGLGNARFVSRVVPRPKYATKGEAATRVMLELELKMLADVGLVGLPNAGKSTLLRALSASRTRVGSWAFTTLQPSIGTVVLDSHRGRPALRALDRQGEPRTSFTIADIPGLIEDAHLDKGLGLGFLRHVERAAVLAFVVDLSAGDAVAALKALWREVGEYETLRSRETNAQTEALFSEERIEGVAPRVLPAPAPPISSKPWFVVGTKADLDDTKDNFASLQAYIGLLKDGQVEHPSGKKNAWRKNVVAVPISAIRAEGVERIPRLVVDLLQ